MTWLLSVVKNNEANWSKDVWLCSQLSVSQTSLTLCVTMTMSLRNLLKLAVTMSIMKYDIHFQILSIFKNAISAFKDGIMTCGPTTCLESVVQGGMGSVVTCLVSVVQGGVGSVVTCLESVIQGGVGSVVLTLTSRVSQRADVGPDGLPSRAPSLGIPPTGPVWLVPSLFSFPSLAFSKEQPARGSLPGWECRLTPVQDM